MKPKLKKLSSGFTIVEVLFVLAAAGAIMLIVFLAVPQAQRSSRNAQRRTDVYSLVAVVNQYRNEHTGDVPAASGNFFTDIFKNESPKLGYLSPDNVAWIHVLDKDTAWGELGRFTRELDDGGHLLFINVIHCNPDGTAVTSDDPDEITAAYYIESSGSTIFQCVGLRNLGA